MQCEKTIADEERNMEKRTKITVRDLNLYYGENHALKDVNMDIQENAVTAFIGPSGCGKSTFLKTLNRMNDLVPSAKVTGKIIPSSCTPAFPSGGGIADFGTMKVASLNATSVTPLTDRKEIPVSISCEEATRVAVKFTDAGHVRLRIQATPQSNNLVRLTFEIEDTGIGIKEDKLKILSEKLLEPDFNYHIEEEQSGFGLFNVNERIKLYFGNEYGISIESTYEIGTKIKIIIPVMG